MKVLLIRPPFKISPWGKEEDYVLPPLGIASIAGILLKNDIKVTVLDCGISKVGWKTLEKVIKEESPDIIGSSEHFHSYHEVLKLFNLVKKINPNIITVGGGIYASYLPQIVLRNNADYVVIGEGEITFLELVKELKKPLASRDISKIAGIAYYDKNKKVKINKPRELISHLDDLPMPAYELLKTKEYAKNSIVGHKGFTVEHSRGCCGSCSFCILWKMWGSKSNNTVKPCFRAKSVKRTLDEVEILVKNYDKETIYFIDDNFALDPQWNKEFCEEIKRRNLHFLWVIHLSAFTIIRDYKLGILPEMVRCGLVMVTIGVERHCSKDLKAINKLNTDIDMIKEAFHILTKFPTVLTTATAICGIEDEDERSIKQLGKFLRDLDADVSPLLLLTPFPGTTEWDKAEPKGMIKQKDFRKYNWTNPIMPTKYLSMEKLEELSRIEMLKFFYRPGRFFKVFSMPKGFRRRVMMDYNKFILATLFKMIFNKMIGKDLLHYRVPEWYNK